MTPRKKSGGLGLLCSLEGYTTEVFYDGVGLGDRPVIGFPLGAILEPGSARKGREFLKAIRDQGSAHGCSMDVLANGKTLRLFFGGTRTDDRIAIIAFPAPAPVPVTESLRKLFEEKTTNEALEIAARELIAKDEQEFVLYEQLIRTNNELVNTQRELARKNLELERLSEEKTELLSVAAHDLRHPIGAILVFSELLIEEAQGILNDEHNQLLESIHSSSEFMLLLLDDVLDISAIESGRMRITPRRVNFPEVVAQSVGLSRALADRKQTELVFRQTGSIPSVSVDPLKMRQVLDNLIGNAIKYSHRNARIEVSIAMENDNVVVSVKDNGPGIPPNELKNLFVPFHKTRARANSAERGTGLGLAIAKRIVEHHSGRIWVDSRVGIGSTFYVSVPASGSANLSKGAAAGGFGETYSDGAQIGRGKAIPH
jgi:signal transduction histidine kinase